MGGWVFTVDLCTSLATPDVHLFQRHLIATSHSAMLGKCYMPVRTIKMANHDIVTELIESFIQQENYALLGQLRSAQQEAEALRHRLSRLSTLYGMVNLTNNRLSNEVETMRTTIDMMDIISREYFLNSQDARERWGPYCSFEDEEFMRMATEIDVEYDFTGMMEPILEGEFIPIVQEDEYEDMFMDEDDMFV
ncbi:uncharacterized protein PHALS_02479 [Plasmopara halstedii]|uniref:Uncharacterized protein n=1 Tax=Plasmopara halstedii TaxID=4781 RepID=A0A0P1AUX2_PLAHL|nr:uncharacterized protein PHALS_02479 [Plasmopara halstedii]CEG46095.1 hypothetical protein PHALS_02479 [Plasmopara halstedii]|eukprot:XP_024582464.1 hypothetical protein PHALS_02479 [Plasmopara halstedii]